MNTNSILSERIKTRSSNIELMRIVAMVVIVLSHMAGHGGIINSAKTQNLLWGGVLCPGGKIGYDCFIIITAWFSEDGRFKGSRYLTVALEVIFYNLLGMGLAASLNNGLMEPITLRNWLGCLLPISGNAHGFAVYYLIFILILPLLHLLARNMNRKNIIAAVSLLFIMQIWSKVFSVVINYEPFVDLDNGLFTFIILYFLVTYLKKWHIKFMNNKPGLAAILGAIWAFNATINILARVYPTIPLFTLSLNLINHDISPLNMIAGFCLFFLFKDMKFQHSTVINVIASHTFAVLLLHDHNYFRYVIWKRVFQVERMYNANLAVLIGYCFGVMVVIFIVSILIDVFREHFLERPIKKTTIFHCACAKLEEFFNFNLFTVSGDDRDKTSKAS